MQRVSSAFDRSSIASLGIIVVVAFALAAELRAQSPASSSDQQPAPRSSSHRVRVAGIAGAALGLTAGVTGANMMGFGDAGSAARDITYLGASGAVAGWIVGTVVALPFHGRSEIGPNDVHNATVTGAVVGLTTGVAAGSLMGFKCANGCSAATSTVATIALTGFVGGVLGAAIGHGVGMALPH